jgi:hypothetical protein
MRRTRGPDRAVEYDSRALRDHTAPAADAGIAEAATATRTTLS